MKRLLVYLLPVAVVSVFFGVLAHGRARARYEAASTRIDAACRAWRRAPGHADADVCRLDDYGPSMVQLFKAARGRLDEARFALGRADGSAAREALASAIASAHTADARGTTLGSAIASKLIEGALDVLASNRGALSGSEIRELLAGARLDTARHPLVSAGIHHAWSLAHDEALSPAEAADEIENDEARFAEMQRAALALDTDACKKAALDLGPRAFPGAQAVACEKEIAAYRTATRLDAALAAAR